MNKKVRTWLLILGMATPTLFSGCLTTLSKDMRDAAFQGASNAVRDSIFDQVLDALALTEE